MHKIVILSIFTLLLSSCSSLEVKNLGKSVATTAVTYAVAGPVPAVVNAATSVVYDEVVPESPKVAEIETKEQAVAYVADSFFMNSLYAFIGFLVITNILVPWITRRQGYQKAKDKYREDIK